MKKKIDKEITDSELTVSSKLKIVANILESLKEIFLLLNPLIKKILSMEEAEQYHKNGTLKRVEKLFDNISKQCRSITNLPIPYELFKDLKN